MMPPFNTPGNASYLFSGVHSATTSSPLGKLRMRKPSAFAGPQPQQELLGAYFSWSDCSFIRTYQRLASASRQSRAAVRVVFHAPSFNAPAYGRNAGPL